MSDAFVGVAKDGTGKKIDADAVTTASGTVHRQRVVSSDPIDANSHARVKAIADAVDADKGLVVSAKAFLDQLAAIAGLDTKLASILTALGLRATETTLASVLTGVLGLGSGATSTVVVPAASDIATVHRELFIGTGGTVVGYLYSDDTASRTFKNIPSSGRLPYRFKRILATSTAADMLLIG